MRTLYFTGMRCISHEQECGEAVHKALHLSDPWKAFSMNIDDTEIRVDIRIRSKGRVDHICPDCRCL